MRKAPRCTWKNFPGAPFWICRNLRLGYSSLILGWRPKAMTRRAPALRVNYSTKVYVTRQGGQQIDNLTSEFWTMWKFCTIADRQINARQIKKYNIWWLVKPRRLDDEDLMVKPGTKVDDESVILMKILTSCKIHARSIRRHYLGWKMVGESEFDLKIARGSTQHWKILKFWPGTTNIWERRPGA